MMIYKWVGARPKGLIVGAFKKQIKKQQDSDKIIRIQFNFETVYVLADYRGELRTVDGRTFPVEIACLNTPGWVIGQRDLCAADNLSWAQEWREMIFNRIQENLQLKA